MAFLYFSGLGRESPLHQVISLLILNQLWILIDSCYTVLEGIFGLGLLAHHCIFFLSLILMEDVGL